MGVLGLGELSARLGRRRRWLPALLALAVAGGVATGSAGAASAAPPSGYVNPLRAATGLIAERIDEGVDYAAAGGSPIYALGNGIVTSLYNSGWPNRVFLVYQLTSGPAQGWSVYVAEDASPAVTVGQQVTAGTVLGHFVAGADGGYDIEMGWADPCSCGEPLAATYGQYPVDGDATAFGRNFNDLMTTLGAPVGSIQGHQTGSLPPGWPVWSALNPVQAVFFAAGKGHLHESVFGSHGWHGGFDMCASRGWGCTPSSAAGVAVNPATDQQYVFWRGARGDINEAFHQAGAWHGPIDMCMKRGWGCGVASGAPSVAVGDNGNQYVAYRGRNGHLYESVFGSNGWRGEQDMCTSHGWGCTASSAAGLAVNPTTNEQYVFWRGARGDINEAFHQAGAWHGPIDMCTKRGWGCGVTAGTPSVGVAADGNQYVVYRGRNGHIYESVFGSNGWRGEQDMCATRGWGCTPSSAPSVAVNATTDQQYVFWRGARGGMFEAFHQSGAWHGPIDMCSSAGWGCRVGSVAPSVAVSASAPPAPPVVVLPTPTTKAPHKPAKPKPTSKASKHRRPASSSSASKRPPKTSSPAASPSPTPAPPTSPASSSPTHKPSPKPSSSASPTNSASSSASTSAKPSPSSSKTSAKPSSSSSKTSAKPSSSSSAG